MGFWEDLKDAFKTKSQRDEERAEEMRKALEAEKEVTKIFRKKRKTTSGSGYFDELGNVQHIQVRTNSKQFHWTHLSLSKRKKNIYKRRDLRQYR